MAANPKKRQQIAALVRTFGKDRMLELVSTGHTIKQIRALYEFETKGKYMTDYFVCKALQSFGDEYEAAKRAAASHHVDKIVEVTEKVEEGTIDYAAARVVSDNRKWIAAKLDPRQYGDRIQADIQVTDMTSLHLAALKEAMRPKSIEARVIEGTARLEREEEGSD